jgi:transcriptional regulator with XRE-family HTH domain
MDRFPEKLRILRERHDMTMRKLADELDLSHAYIYKLEAGQRKPNVELLLKLSELFGVSVDVLVKDEVEVGAAARGGRG